MKTRGRMAGLWWKVKCDLPVEPFQWRIHLKNRECWIMKLEKDFTNALAWSIEPSQNPPPPYPTTTSTSDSYYFHGLLSAVSGPGNLFSLLARWRRGTNLSRVPHLKCKIILKYQLLVKWSKLKNINGEYEYALRGWTLTNSNNVFQFSRIRLKFGKRCWNYDKNQNPGKFVQWSDRYSVCEASTNFAQDH